MAGRPTKLTAPVYREMLKEIRRGAFDWVAAEAAGVSRSSYYRWVRRSKRGDQPFKRVMAGLRKARAQTRTDAEGRVHERDPLAWLRMGPGRERRGEPGWTEPVKAQGGRPDDVDVEDDEEEDEDPEMVAELERALDEVEREEVKAGWDDDDDEDWGEGCEVCGAKCASSGAKGGDAAGK